MKWIDSIRDIVIMWRIKIDQEKAPASDRAEQVWRRFLKVGMVQPPDNLLLAISLFKAAATQKATHASYALFAMH